jgi:hypothetical protein
MTMEVLSSAASVAVQSMAAPDRTGVVVMVSAKAARLEGRHLLRPAWIGHGPGPGWQSRRVRFLVPLYC